MTFDRVNVKLKTVNYLILTIKVNISILKIKSLLKLEENSIMVRLKNRQPHKFNSSSQIT